MSFELFLNILTVDVVWQVAHPNTRRRCDRLSTFACSFACSFASVTITFLVLALRCSAMECQGHAIEAKLAIGSEGILEAERVCKAHGAYSLVILVFGPDTSHLTKLAEQFLKLLISGISW
jgi:hypothetical protein